MTERDHRSIPEHKQEERLYCKKLNLVTPEYARRLGIMTDLPVFVSSTDSTEGRPFVYQVGETLRVSYFEKEGNESVQTIHEVAPQVASLHSRPKYGIGYWDEPAFVTTNGCLFWGDMQHGLKYGGWVAILEPKGKIVHHEDYFLAFNAIAEEVRIKNILAFCRRHKEGWEEIQEPLKEGIVVNIGSPYLESACSYAAHKDSIDKNNLPWFGFYYDQDGKIVFDLNFLNFARL